MDEAIVDANVLLRLIVDDSSELAARANIILELASDRKISLIVSSLTLAEVVYVLQSVYKWDRDTIAIGLADLIETSKFTFPESEILLQTLTLFKNTRQIHFADAYVAATALSRHHGTVLTFDREFRRIPELALINDVNDIN